MMYTLLISIALLAMLLIALLIMATKIIIGQRYDAEQQKRVLALASKRLWFYARPESYVVDDKGKSPSCTTKDAPLSARSERLKHCRRNKMRMVVHKQTHCLHCNRRSRKVLCAICVKKQEGYIARLRRSREPYGPY